jgi:phage-related baseplate assembly protein
MSGAFTAVDLSNLPAPTVVEQVSFEEIFEEMLTDLQARDNTFDALVESDPVYKLLQVAAYREMAIRQRANDAAKAIMLAFAKGTDLDQIAANYNVERLVIDEGNPNALPPVPPTYESDESLLRRIQLSPEGYSSAGPTGAYIFHALGADAEVLDVSVDSPDPGDVVVYVLSRTGDGTADSDLLETVEAVLSDEDIRPLTDNLSVESATIVEYAVDATLTLYAGPDQEVVEQAAIDALDIYIEKNHRLRRDVTLSGIYAALHVEGVQNVSLAFPEADVVVDTGEAAYCTGRTVDVGGIDE